MNYSELTTAIEDTTENTFEAAQLATFVQQAEQFIYNTVQPPALRRNQTSNLTANLPYLTLPNDYLYTNSLAVIDGQGNYRYLLNKDVNFIREAYSNSSATGLPKHYSNFDIDSLLVGPTPDSSYAIELHYGYYPESIVTAGNTWLGDTFDNVLFNAALVEAAKFMKSEADIVQLYKAQRDQALLLLDGLSDGKLRTDTYRKNHPMATIT